MNHVLDIIEEHIFDFIVFQYGKDKVNSPNDIINAIEEDATEEIKDRLWDLIKYELKFSRILDKLDEIKEKEKEEETYEDSVTEEEEEEEEED